MHDVQVFWFLSATFTLLTNLTWFAPTYLHFSRLCFDQLCTRSAHDDKKCRVLKIHCVDWRSSTHLADYSIALNEDRKREETRLKEEPSKVLWTKRSVFYLYSMRPPVLLLCPKSTQKLRPTLLLVSAEYDSEPHNSNVTQWILLH